MIERATTFTARHVRGTETEDFRRELVQGLSQSPKRIPCKFLYDAEGSRLFDQICELEEYYPTRTEIGILENHIQEIRSLCGPECLLAELGSGTSTKTRLLLDQLENLIAYVPIEISREQLTEAAAALNSDYPDLEIVPLCADYHQTLRLPKLSRKALRTVVFFPGSTIGNFEPAEAVSFLNRVASLSRPGGAVLVGVDLKKDSDVLERAYNDSAGVTAAFNLNLLVRANRELGTDFNVDHFRHRAVYDSARGRIEMRLESRIPQTIWLEREFRFEANEPIVTEHSYKYSIEGFRELAGRAGLQIRRVWTDARNWFSFWFLVPT